MTSAPRAHPPTPARPGTPGAVPRAAALRRLRRIACGALALSALSAGAMLPVTSAHAAELAFPFHTDFDSADGGTLSGDAEVGDGWLRLTDAVRSEAGSWATDDVFASDLGLEIEFRYAMHGGTGADGLLMSLSDGAVAPGVGRPGAALGYSCYDDSGHYGTCDVAGMPGAFVGVGFDLRGNFSRPFNGSGPGPQPDHVVLRGSGNGTDGYRFLRGAVGPDGGVGTQSRSDERTVHVTLLPAADGVLALTVRSDSGPGTRMRTVIDQVALEGDGQAPLPDTLRLGFTASTGNSTNAHEVDDLTVSIPTDVGITQEMPERVVAGTHVRYTATATNRGRNGSARNDVVIATPTELHDVRWTCAATAGAACGAGSGAGPEIATTADIDPGATVTWTIEGDLAADATGQIASAARITTPPSRADTNTADNASTVRAAIGTDAALRTEKAAELLPGDVELLPGGVFRYTITAVNGGPSDARRVGAVDDLPEPVRFVGSEDGCRADGQHVTCSSAVTVAPGERHRFRFDAQLDAGYRGDGADVLNVAIATSPDDPDDGDPSDPVPLPGPIGTIEPPVVTPTTPPHGGEHPTATPRPSASATPVAAGAHPARLAFTGTVGTAAAVLVAAIAVVTGLGVRSVRRRRELERQEDPAA
ncbi:DUF11 domain-containing protein [Curtobacterium sp. MCBD17_013]|uniref:DUF11 domain-containing protein n=1 Tax=Curtobacterium sp. MCBD17_013 TaxID=2175668 RepID=UPI0015E8DDCC|nr:DUF11 domain-containing protein [Curtobacterium sp. MCBD17_013]